MCGRFSIHLADLSEIGGPLGVTRSGIEVWEPRYNVAPTQQAPIIAGGEERRLTLHQWGLVPHWAEDPAIGARLINARIETVARTPAFRHAFANKRCVVPATGYFEWQKCADGHRQPMWIHPNGEPLLWFAGLRSRWVSPDGEGIDTFSILTRDARGVAADIHDRMPVALPIALVDAWLDVEGQDGAALLDRVREATDGDGPLDAHPVSTHVNRPVHDDPACIEPITPPSERQLSLF